MCHYKTILLATSNTIIDCYSLASCAISLAEKLGARLCLLHVLDKQEVGEQALKLHSKAKQTLAALGQKFSIPSFDQQVSAGELCGSIIDYVQSHQIDLLVLDGTSVEGIEKKAIVSLLKELKCDITFMRARDLEEHT